MQDIIWIIFQEATGNARRPVRLAAGHRPFQNVKHFRGVWEFAQDASPAAWKTWAREPGTLNYRFGRFAGVSGVLP